MENWKAVPGYQGQYEVSDLGNVRSLDRILTNGHRRLGRVLRTNRHHTNDYLSVQLCRGQENFRCGVHRLVLEAFIGPPPQGYQAAHNNGIRTDNRLSNLRWDSIAANHADKERHGTKIYGERQWNAKLNESQVTFIRNMMRAGAPAKELVLMFGIQPGSAHKIKNFQSWNNRPQ